MYEHEFLRSWIGKQPRVIFWEYMVESHYLTLLWIWDKRVAKIHWLRSSHSCDQITGAFFDRMLLSMQMDMQAHLSYSFSSSRVGKFSPPSFSNYYPLRPFCSRDQKSRDPNPDGGDNGTPSFSIHIIKWVALHFDVLFIHSVICDGRVTRKLSFSMGWVSLFIYAFKETLLATWASVISLNFEM